MEKSVGVDRGITGNPVYLGYDTMDAAGNMAMDESMLNFSERTGSPLVRFYSFSNPTIILSSSDHPGNIKMENLNGTDVSRRKTGGKPIYLDSGVLAYSITGRVDGHKENWPGTPERIHAVLGKMVADSLSEIVDPRFKVMLGKSYSIRVDGKPIAGHGQLVKGSGAFLYHGLIAVQKWDAGRIDALLRLIPEDYEKLAGLPNIQAVSSKGDSIESYKRLIMNAMLGRLGAKMGAGNDERGRILDGASSLVGEYRSHEFVFRNDDKLKLSSRFCLLWEG